MELKLAVIFGLYCLLFIQIAGSIIVPSADADKFDGLKKDIPVASGASPDDEDGDVDEGSGSSEDQFEGSGGGLMKGSVDSNSNSYSNSNRFNTNNVTLTSPTLDTTTTSVINKIDTGSKRPVDKLPPHRPFDNDYNEKEVDHDDDEEDSLNESSSRQNEDHVLIEDSSTARTVPAFKPFPTVRTTQLVTPSLSDAVDSNRIYFGTLFKPGILAAVIGGFVVGILAAILLVMFIVYRMRKKDEGSYALDEQKQPPMYPYAYQKASTKEFYA